MIITDKDLGLLIVGGKPVPSTGENGLHQLMSLDFNDGRVYHLAIRNGLSYNNWKYVTEETVKEFCNLFNYIKYIEMTTNSIYYSERYDIIFEGEEESLLYWRLKYIDI